MPTMAMEFVADLDDGATLAFKIPGDGRLRITFKGVAADRYADADDPWRQFLLDVAATCSWLIEQADAEGEVAS